MAVPYGTRFPQWLSNQLQILWWEFDEAFLIFIFFGIWIMTFTWATFFLMIIVPWLFVRAKRKNSKGYFKHLLYYCGFVKFKGYPTFFERNFLE